MMLQAALQCLKPRFTLFPFPFRPAMFPLLIDLPNQAAFCNANTDRLSVVLVALNIVRNL
jgi:hypothetical protein